MMGVEVDRVIIMAFFLGSALAGAGGLIFGLYYNFTSFIIGFTAGLRAFTAAVLGGIGNVPGAMVGGVLIGLIEAMSGPVHRHRLDRRDHLLDPGAGAGVQAGRPARARGAEQVLTGRRRHGQRRTTAAPSLLLRPIAWIPEVAAPAQLGIALLIVAALLFPLRRQQRRRHRRHGERGGLCHAGARAQHRRRLRRPARPGLCRVLRHRRLYLRHPHRLPAAAALERVLGAVPLPRPGRRRCRRRSAPAAWCISRCRSGWPCRWRPGRGVLRRAVRRPHLRLRGDYLAIVTLGFGEIVPIVVRNWSDLTNGAAGLNGIAAPRLFGWSFGVDSMPYYYVAIVHGGDADLHLHPIARFAHRPCLDGDPRGRDRRRRDGRGPHASSSCWPSPSAPRSPA